MIAGPGLSPGRWRIVGARTGLLASAPMGSPDDRFPRMTAYLESLPRGTESYPAALSKASLIRHMQESMPFEASPGELPEALHALWEAPPPSSSWVSTAQFLALTLAYGDAHFPREADFHEWLYGLSAALYAKPLYRFLMYVATPRQLVHGAAKRWHQFHQGTDLELAEEGDGQAVLAVHFPPKLYTPPVLGTNVAALRAAVTAAGGKDVRGELTHVTDTEGRMRFTWR